MFLKSNVIVAENNKTDFCPLCSIVDKGADITGRIPIILYENKSFVATVDIGSMIEGYALISCKRHINSMGELTDDEFSDFTDIQDNIRSGLKKIYNKNCVCFEHGSGKINRGKSASSVKHAHFHMVAIDSLNSNIHKEIIENMEMFEMKSQRELKNYTDKPYVYYISGKEMHYLSIKERVESQYMRKIIAKQFNTSYNWKDPATRETFRKNLLSTEEKWKKCTMGFK